MDRNKVIQTIFSTIGLELEKTKDNTLLEFNVGGYREDGFDILFKYKTKEDRDIVYNIRTILSDKGIFFDTYFGVDEPSIGWNIDWSLQWK